MSPTLAYLKTNKTHVLILSSSSICAPHPHACPPALSHLTFTSQYTQNFFFQKNLYIWLCQVLAEALEIFDLHCDMQTLSCGVWDLVP